MQKESSDHAPRREHGRPDLRLPFFDYTSLGPYFITLCTENRVPMFGEVVDEEMVLNACGKIVYDEWLRSRELRKELMLDEFVVMPNHLHAIVGLAETEGRAHGRVHLPKRKRSPRPSRGLASFVAGFKAYSTKCINEKRCTPHQQVWQANYYERVIRNERELARFRRYINTNELRWTVDRDHPDHPAHNR